MLSLSVKLNARDAIKVIEVFKKQKNKGIRIKIKRNLFIYTISIVHSKRERELIYSLGVTHGITGTILSL